MTASSARARGAGRTLPAGYRTPGRSLRTAGLVAFAALAGLAGCTPKRVAGLRNLPPETTVFVQGPVDTVNHRVRIYWFGTDADGDVVAYEFRFVFSPPAPQDPPWNRIACALPGRCTDSLFTVPTGDSVVVSPRFEIRAIDNQGAADPTPASQRLLLRNLAPIVTITNPLSIRDSSFASVSVNWIVDDPDGGGPGLRYRLWLDGNQANYDSTVGLSFTLATSRFLQNGTFASGPRTLYVQGVDDGESAGPPATMTWYVRAPAAVMTNNQGRLLLIDDSPRAPASANDASVDTLYANTLARNLPPGTYSILRLDPSSPFRTSADLAQTLRLFEAVAWYRGFHTTVSPTLQAHQDSLGAFLLAGGRLYLEGLYLIAGHNSFGTLREEFVTTHLNCRRLFRQYDPNAFDSTVGLATVSTATLRSSLYPGNPMRLASVAGAPGSSPGMRGFVPNDTSQVALWALPGSLTSPTNADDLPVAMTVTRPPGRLIFVPFPIRALPPLAGFDGSFRVLPRLLFGTEGLIPP